MENLTHTASGAQLMAQMNAVIHSKKESRVFDGAKIIDPVGFAEIFNTVEPKPMPKKVDFKSEFGLSLREMDDQLDAIQTEMALNVIKELDGNLDITIATNPEFAKQKGYEVNAELTEKLIKISKAAAYSDVSFKVNHYLDDTVTITSLIHINGDFKQFSEDEITPLAKRAVRLSKTYFHEVMQKTKTDDENTQYQVSFEVAKHIVADSNGLVNLVNLIRFPNKTDKNKKTLELLDFDFWYGEIMQALSVKQSCAEQELIKIAKENKLGYIEHFLKLGQVNEYDPQIIDF